MIKDIRLSNFKAFLAPQKFSLMAKKSDRLQGNYLREGRSLLYKSAAIFSGNNVGKTSFLEAVFLLKKALLGEDIASYAEPNVHAKDAVVKMDASFSLDDLFKAAADPDMVLLDFTGTDDDFEVSEEDINIGISLQKGNTELLDMINEGLQILMDNGEFDALKAKWGII